MGKREDELRRLEDQGAAVALEAGADPGQLAGQLAGMQSAAMGAGVADRYAQMGARWLSDQVPTRVDGQLLDRLARQGFRRDSLADVRIHRGTKAQAAASALGARAFAIGDRDIFFGQGEFDPSTRTGRAVLAHELAHVAPPDLSGGFGSGGFGGSGGIPGSFQSGAGMGAPVLNERKQGDEDAAGGEAHEKQARAAEARVFAQDDGPAGASANAGDVAPGPGGTAPVGQEHKKLEAHALEAKVWAIMAKWERTEMERAGEH